MRYFKCSKDAHLARMLLDFLEMDEHYRKGKVSLGILSQYFGSPEMQKTYPPAERERILKKLIDAGLIVELAK